jgi:hypothetical protein
MSYLSQELCGCPERCAGMAVINEMRPYQYLYQSEVITDVREYEWMGYVSFPADRVFIRGNTFPIDCSNSDFYKDGASFYTYTKVDDYTCVYNQTSFINGFLSLRKLSAQQDITIYFNEDRRRELCGWCGCNNECVRVTSIIAGVLTGIVVLLFLTMMIKYKNKLKRLCSKGTSITFKLKQ